MTRVARPESSMVVVDRCRRDLSNGEFIAYDEYRVGCFDALQQCAANSLSLLNAECAHGSIKAR
jgi:hypothetical protein